MQRPVDRVDVFGARRIGCDRIIVDIGKGSEAGAGISGELMNGGEGDAGIMRNNILGPIPMMGVKIPDRDALGSTI